MKKAMTGVLVAGVSAALLSGCASVKTAKTFNGQKIDASGTPVAHINANNWGYYMLWIPILSGGTAEGSVGQIAVNKDTVSVESMVDLITRESKAMGATKTVDLQSDLNSISILPIPIPFLFSLKTVEVSGNAVK
jgi:uncharacterized protein YceK